MKNWRAQVLYTDGSVMWQHDRAFPADWSEANVMGWFQFRYWPARLPEATFSVIDSIGPEIVDLPTRGDQAYV